jgi:hypothetical protein
MNNAVLGSPVLYQRQIRQALAAPSSVSATPDLETAAAAYMAGRAASQREAQAQALKTGLQEAGLAEKARQFSATTAEKGRQFDATSQQKDTEFAGKLADQRKYMDDWEKQNKWATAIGVMNLATQGVSSWDQNKKMEEQQAIQKKLIDLNQQQLKATTDNIDQQKFWQRAQLNAMNNNSAPSFSAPALNLSQIANQPSNVPFYLRRNQ